MISQNCIFSLTQRYNSNYHNNNATTTKAHTTTTNDDNDNNNTYILYLPGSSVCDVL